MITETITTINERIDEQLATDAVEIAGLSIVFHDQQEKTATLKLADDDQRFTMNSAKLWQSTHLLDGSTVTNKQQFGSFTDHTYDIRFVLIVLSKSSTGLDVAMRALDNVAYVVIDGVETSTFRVLQTYFNSQIGQGKNYDPALCAFAIRYRLTGVRDEDYAELLEIETPISE